MVANKGIICTKIGCRFDEKHQMRQPLLYTIRGTAKLMAVPLFMFERRGFKIDCYFRNEICVL